MLCLKKKKFWGSSSSYGPQSQSKSFGLESGNGTSAEETNKRGSRDPSRTKDNMAPPPTAAPAIHPVVREVTEDTPPDLLEGTMDLMVILPSGKTVTTTVDRKTPMMDLLIHTATANKINPGGHIVQVRNERGIEMPYKPSTPIGALDTTTIEIVPKNRVNEYIIVKKPAKVANQPFETTFRLQVHLPRNQLYVMRISPKTMLDDILREVCQEKNLDISKYEIRHPVNLDQRLPLSISVGETGLHELTVVSKNSKINSSVSTADIMALQQSDDCRGKGCLDGSFKHSRSSVGDSSVSSESTGSGRGISPCRSEDSRSISPLPLVRPKTLMQSRPSYMSTCSSSGNSSGLHRTLTVDGSPMSSQILHQQVVMQAPPRTKKRAAPQPPSTPGAKGNSVNGSVLSLNVSSPVSENSIVLCSTPINGNSNGGINSDTKTAAGPPERPTPRKKEAPREPPKQHAPLSHHQSLPLNHSRHNSGNTDYHNEVGAFVSADQNDSRQLDRDQNQLNPKMTSRHSMSSSMTNLTSVSSVSSTSLASSTGGGSKKRRAPKPPALGALNTPTQIEEETITTDSDASTLRGDVGGKSGGEFGLDQRSSASLKSKSQNSESMPVAGATDVDMKEMEKLRSVSPASSLSSQSNSAFESTTSHPIPTASEPLASKSTNKTFSVAMMKGRHRSPNTNEDSSGDAGGQAIRGSSEHDENESRSTSYSRSSSSPSSSNNIGNNVVAATSPPSPDSVRSRVSSSIAVDDAQSVVVEETTAPTASSRPPSSSNTQVSSSSRATASPAQTTMPLPVPRRRAPTAPPDISPNKISIEQTGKVSEKTMQTQPPQEQSPQPMPKPRPRTDRKSVQTIVSANPNIIKPHVASRPEMTTRQSTDSNPDTFQEDESAGRAPSPPVTKSVQLRNPLSMYGVKVLPDNVLKERAERLKQRGSSSESVPSSAATSPIDAHASTAFEDAPPHKSVYAKGASSLTRPPPSHWTSGNLLESGSNSSFGSTNTGNLAKSEFPSSKPQPKLSKSDYTGHGSVRSLNQLTAQNATGKTSGNDHYGDKEGYESDDLEENLDFFEPAQETIPGNTVVRGGSSLPKFVSSQSATHLPSTAIQNEKKRDSNEVVKPRVQAAPPTKPRVVSRVPASSKVDDDRRNSSTSTGVALESGFDRTSSQRDQVTTKRKTVENDSGKLNRWQNTDALNEINESSMTRKGGRSVSPTPLLHADYQHTKIHLSDESQNDATCHSSESESSYTDSGVPATETVTPSPVNLDDVILDHEYHAGSHQEKFSSEDGDELKNSSRRSSLQSDHSEEWMNVVQSKLNKEEKETEKMFEAALINPEEESSGFESATLLDTDVERETKATVMKESNKQGSEEESDEEGKADVITTTAVQLHHVPSDSKIETESDGENLREITVRKLSKSESFSHNSEFEEAKQKRKVFSSRSNTLQLQQNSQNSSSATDLRQSESEDEVETLPETKTRAASMQPSTARENRTVSMTNLSSSKKDQDPRKEERNMYTDSDKQESTSSKQEMLKTASLRQLSGDKDDDPVEVDMYRKQLEIQFEQWKQEFMKNHAGSKDTPENPANMKMAQDRQVEETPNHHLSESKVEQRTPRDNFNATAHGPQPHEVPEETQVALSVDVEEDEHESQSVLESTDAGTLQNDHEDESLLSEVVKSSDENTPGTNEEVEQESNIIPKDEPDFSTVELRKKNVQKQESLPAVVYQYQYTGPPTIKMSAWKDTNRRAVSVKDDADYIMGFGQQDPNHKTANSARVHSYGGGPIVQIAPYQGESNKVKRESSPNPSAPVKGWSAAINAPSVVRNSTGSGSVRSVLSTWKQKMEETEKEKIKPVREGPPAEIDIYGSGSETTYQSKPKPVSSQNGVASRAIRSGDKTAPPKNISISTEESRAKPVVIATKPIVKATPPQEKFNTLGSSFRTEKPVSFTISPMESNTLPRNKPILPKPAAGDTIDVKVKPAASAQEVNGSGTLEQRKKFFQGIKPVENGKEAPIPASNMKGNIAAIQKVFEKQHGGKMQQMGSQQSLNSDGTVSPDSSLNRNDSLESRQSINIISNNNSNNLRRQNSLESQGSNSSSVVLRVSQNSSGKMSPQFSSTEMVQKLLGRPNSFNIDTARRTPSPISSTTSTLSSSTSYERFTPSPTVVDGPNNSVRITTGGYKPSNQNSSIRSVGNKAIIIVNGQEAQKNPDQDKRTIIKQSSSVNDNIILDDSGIKPATKSSAMASYVSVIAAQQQQNKRDSNPPALAKQNTISAPPTAPSVTIPAKSAIVTEPSQKTTKVPLSNGVPPPPPPPPVDIIPMKPLPTSPSGSTLRNSKPSTPTSPTSSDPRAEIFNAIRNSNGNFGLRKTGSSVLLK